MLLKDGMSLEMLLTDKISRGAKRMTHKQTNSNFIKIDSLIFKAILLCRCPKVSLVVEKHLTMENHIFSVPHRHVEDPDKQDFKPEWVTDFLEQKFQQKMNKNSHFVKDIQPCYQEMQTMPKSSFLHSLQA